MTRTEQLSAATVAADYGDHFVGVYDDWYGGDDMATQDAVAMLSGYAGTGRVLELGAGTGRLAIPLAQKGYDVTGVDISEAMLAEFARKDPEGLAHRIRGDMTEPPVDGVFGLIFMAFNTLFCLTSADDQERCIASAARLLAPGGRFVVDTFVPSRTMRPGLRTTVLGDSQDRSQVQVVRHDPRLQLLFIDLIVTEGTNPPRIYPNAARYMFPEEIAAAADAAGLRLTDRFLDWQGGPADDSSRRHILVFQAARPTDGDCDQAGG